MGQKLLEIFDVVTQKVGLKGRIELAEKIGISKKNAETLEDSAKNIAEFKKAASEIIGENIDRYLRKW